MSKISLADWLPSLKQASSFDLYRLRALINDEIDNPKRQARLLQSLYVGQDLHYYDDITRQQKPCKVTKIYQKYVGIIDLQEQRAYKIPPYMLNLEGKSVDEHLPPGEQVDRHQIKVADTVSFLNKSGEAIQGKVIRLNNKTVSLLCTDGCKWRVSYSFIQSVMKEI